MPLFIVILAFLLLAGSFSWYMLARDQGEHEPVAALWVAFGLGAVGLVVAAACEYFLVPDLFGEVQPLAHIAGAVLGIGVIEELAKSLPLIAYLYHKRYFNEHTDGVIYFALAGLGFGLPENVLYTFQYGADTGVARLLMTPLFHAATTALVGYAVVRLKLDGRPVRSLLWAVLGVIAVHALYDFGLFSGVPAFALLSVMITLALAGGVFALLLYARDQDQLAGLSAVGHNSFCRSCGHHNPKHNLYCSQCGKRA